MLIYIKIFAFHINFLAVISVSSSFTVDIKKGIEILILYFIKFGSFNFMNTHRKVLR